MKKTRLWILLIVSSILSFAFVNEAQQTNGRTKPNIILILMDDMGYGDLSCYGALSYKTTNIDLLAHEGIRFTNYLAAQPICTASRAALLTGCYPNRIGLTMAIMPAHKNGINTNETTMAEILKENGYRTAIFGKWHLGHQPEFMPNNHGFDEYLGLPYSNDMNPYYYDWQPSPSHLFKSTFPTLQLYHNREVIKDINTQADHEELTTIFTEKAVEFINKNKKDPFFLYLPHTMPHVPIAVSSKFKGKSKQGLWADMMLEIDWSVGEIMQALKKNKLDQNTIVIFTSDNGPWSDYGNHAGSAGGFREGKQTTFEGGLRVPLIVRWPNTVRPATICNQLIAEMDILPTLANLTGSKLPKVKIDGVDFSSILKGNLEDAPRKHFYYYYKSNALQAVRMGNWKLVLPHESKTYIGQVLKNDGFPAEPVPVQKISLALYDLTRDPAEQHDVKDIYPEKLVELQKVANQAREELGDELMNIPLKNGRLLGNSK
jgi:arylsulfatase